MSGTYYIHYRAIGKDGAIRPHGGATVAFRYAEGSLTASIAWCDPKDVFNKKIGRMVATGRLNMYQTCGRCENYIVQIPTTEDAIFKDVINTEIGPLMRDEGYV